MITYDNSIFNIIQWFNLGAIVVKFTMCNSENGENSSIDVVLTFEFGIWYYDVENGNLL